MRHEYHEGVAFHLAAPHASEALEIPDRTADPPMPVVNLIHPDPRRLFRLQHEQRHPVLESPSRGG